MAVSIDQKSKSSIPPPLDEEDGGGAAADDEDAPVNEPKPALAGGLF